MTWLKTEALRHGWGEPEWLFPNEEGKPHDEARVRKVFKRALGKAKRAAGSPSSGSVGPAGSARRTWSDS